MGARRKLKAKQEARAAAEAAAGSKKKTVDDDDEDLEWSVDVSSAAVKARRRAALGQSEDGGDAKEKTSEVSPEEEFERYMESDEPVDVNRLRELRDALRLSPTELASRIAANIFNPEKIMKQIIPKAKRWADFFMSSRKAQDALVLAVVDMALIKEETLLSNLPTLLKGLYDQDYVEEEAILEWYESVPVDDARLLKAKLKVAPLATWFREAESEDSE